MRRASTVTARPGAHPPTIIEEARAQTARCAEMHVRVEADRARLERECYLQNVALRRLDSRVSTIGHLPLRHAARSYRPPTGTSHSAMPARRPARG